MTLDSRTFQLKSEHKLSGASSRSLVIAAGRYQSTYIMKASIGAGRIDAVTEITPRLLHLHCNITSVCTLQHAFTILKVRFDILYLDLLVLSPFAGETRSLR
jgi:hypothetical protein